MSTFIELKTVYVPLYLIECEHTRKLYIHSDSWCNSCNDWVDGTEVGDMEAHLEDDGFITVMGGGNYMIGGEING